MAELTAKTCTPCKGGIPPMPREEAEKYQQQVPDWDLVDDAKKITRTFRFKGYRPTVDFVNKIADLADQENHHPDIFFGYGICRVDINTHKIKGLHENDFILAAKINDLAESP